MLIKELIENFETLGLKNGATRIVFSTQLHQNEVIFRSGANILTIVEHDEIVQEIAFNDFITFDDIAYNFEGEITDQIFLVRPAIISSLYVQGGKDLVSLDFAGDFKDAPINGQLKGEIPSIKDIVINVTDNMSFIVVTFSNITKLTY